VVIAVWRLVLSMLTVLRERDRGRGSEREVTMRVFTLEVLLNLLELAELARGNRVNGRRSRAREIAPVASRAELSFSRAPRHVGLDSSGIVVTRPPGRQRPLRPVTPQNEQHQPGLVQLLREDDRCDEHQRAGVVDNGERERHARDADDERADAPDEPNAGIVAIRRMEGCREVTDGSPAEHGGEDDQTIDDKGPHGSPALAGPGTDGVDPAGILPSPTMSR
jgi:hypothetical protein